MLLLLFSSASAKESVYKTDLKVGKLTCGGCLYTINGELKKLDGFLKMGASLFKGEVYVSHKGSLKAKQIEEAISKAGYPSKIMSTNPFDMSKVEKQPEKPQSCCGNRYSCSGSQN
jgi:copper chaperone CopZ